ncbi:MAG: endonuclease, partial [Myxococcales bacterium]|nr:endonuclease [Myxococcales bacterium]
DVVLLQEMNYGNDSSAAFETMVATVCGGGCDYVRGPQEQIPNGVVSRLPILDGGSWTDPQVSNRTFVWARLDAPGNDDLWAISVHLLSSGATQRNLEAQALLSQIASQVPTSDLIVLGGDLNTDSRGETVIGTLGSVFHTAGPHPADQNGNDMTNEPRSRPYDWVLADDDLAPHLVPVVIGSSTFPSGAVIDTRVYTPLAEIAPAQQGDSGAPGMQHMGVVKDFVLP